MSASLVYIGVPLLMYLCQAVTVYLAQGRYGMALAFACYAGANLGFILDTYGI